MKFSLSVALAILVLAPVASSAQSNPGHIQDAQQQAGFPLLPDTDQVFASFGSFIVYLLGSIHLLGGVNFGSIGTAPSVSTTCPYSGTAPVDGCSGAPANGNFQRANFFTYAAQSGQSYGTTRPAWNVACVDYKCGYDTTLTLKDPSAGGLPTNCTYTTNNINCTGTNDITLNGWDLSKPNGCTTITGNNSGNWTLENLNIAYASSTQCNTFFLIKLTAPTSLTVLNVYSNTDNWIKNFGGAVGVIETSNSAPVTVHYSVFLHFPRAVDTSGPGSLEYKYNYYEDFNPNYAQFLGYMASNVLTVTSMRYGTISTSTYSHLAGPNALGTGTVSITAQLTGTDGASCPGETCNGTTGTYSIASASTFYSSGSPGFFYNTNGTHGEKDDTTYTSGTMASYTDMYNTVLMTPNDGNGNAPIAPMEFGVTGPTIITSDVSGNVVVTNRQTGTSAGSSSTGGNVAGSAFFSAAAPNYTTLTIGSPANYIDPTGAGMCFGVGAGTVGTLNYTNGVNLTDGSAITMTGTPPTWTGACANHN